MPPILRTAIFTVLVPGFWTVAVPYWVLPRGAQPDLSGFRPLGGAAIVLGAAIYAWCAFWAFAQVGRGTPGPWDPPRRLVSHGLYRVVRNPMYWGVGLVLLGEATLFRSAVLLWLLLIFVSLVSLFVLLYEEPTLRRTFGDEYEQYCREVPRWLPRLKRRS